MLSNPGRQTAEDLCHGNAEVACCRACWDLHAHQAAPACCAVILSSSGTSNALPNADQADQAPLAAQRSLLHAGLKSPGHAPEPPACAPHNACRADLPHVQPRDLTRQPWLCRTAPAQSLLLSCKHPPVRRPMLTEQICPTCSPVTSCATRPLRRSQNRRAPSQCPETRAAPSSR